MVEHKIVPSSNGYTVRIYDTPVDGCRILFGQKEGAITIYAKYEDAVVDVRIYECSDKTALFDAEYEVYLKALCTGVALGDCGLFSLASFGEPDHYAYATFMLS